MVTGMEQGVRMSKTEFHVNISMTVICQGATEFLEIKLVYITDIGLSGGVIRSKMEVRMEVSATNMSRGTERMHLHVYTCMHSPAIGQSVHTNAQVVALQTST